jgi:hypothetical protein
MGNSFSILMRTIPTPEESGPVAFRKHAPGLTHRGSWPRCGGLSRNMTQLMVWKKGVERADVIPYGKRATGRAGKTSGSDGP